MESELTNTAALLGNIGEFVSAIAVVATLFYIALQVRHAKEATEANTRSIEESRRVAMVDSYIRRLEGMERSMTQLALSAELTDIVARAHANGVTALSDAERMRLFNWEQARLFRVEGQFYQWQQGLLDHEYYDNQFKQVVRFFAPLWNQLGVRTSRPSLQEAIDRVLAESQAP